MTSMFNFVSQCPALSVPAGWTDEGLPVGLQIVARRFRDDEALRIGAAVERELPLGRAGGRRSRLGRVAIVNANGVDLWVEQQGGGPGRAADLGAGRRGRRLGRPGDRPPPTATA